MLLACEREREREIEREIERDSNKARRGKDRERLCECVSSKSKSLWRRRVKIDTWQQFGRYVSVDSGT